MTRTFKPRGRLGRLLAVLAGAWGPIGGCGDPTDDSDGGRDAALQILEDAGIQQIAFISRPKRTDVGDVFQYNSFSVDPKSANIYRLSSVSGGSEPEAITPFGTGDWPKADIMAMDVSFDGQELVFSARLEGDGSYNLYRIKIDGTNPMEPGKKGPELIHAGDYDSVYPVYVPNGRVFFMTNETQPGIRQFRDEYERGLTAQAATIRLEGGDLKLGPRNLSHRVSPSLVAYGEGQRAQILYTNWDHLGDVNEGNLMVMNPDTTGSAEFFGKEGSGGFNSYLKGRQVNDGEFLAIATDRERTFQAGKIILVKRGTNEQSATHDDLTPDVPGDRRPSFEKIGRYYDAYPVTNEKGELTHVVTSWANGAVQSDVAAGGMNEEGMDYGEGAGPPDFGVYVLEPGNGVRLPLHNDADMWDVMPMAIGQARSEPIAAAGVVAATPDGTSLVGALNVLESSLASVPDGGVYRARIIEGFSAEEGIPDDFGLTESDGALLLGEAPVKFTSDNSFAAFVPEDRPIHIQLLDAYGMAVVNEDRWFSSAPGEQRVCGGCHEQRGASSVVDPGISTALGAGASNFALAYADRRLDEAGAQDFAAMAAKIVWPDDDQYATAPRMRGLPWDLGVQQVFDGAGCADCHDGTPGPANPSVIIRDTMSEMPQETMWTFDLRGEKIDFEYGMMTGNYTRSHISLLLLAGLEGERGVELEQVDPANPYQMYVEPQAARASVLLKYVQPEQVYPSHDPSKIAFAGELKDDGTEYEAQHPSPSTPGFDAAVHRPLTEAEKYLLILMADMGGQYYSLENAPGGTYGEGG